jgi:hypothetical protein
VSSALSPRAPRNLYRVSWRIRRKFCARGPRETTWLASSETLKALPEPSADARRKELRWPCRFMTDAQLQSVMNC